MARIPFNALSSKVTHLLGITAIFFFASYCHSETPPADLAAQAKTLSHPSDVSAEAEAEARAELVQTLSIEHLNLDDYISEMQGLVGPGYQGPAFVPFTEAILYADDPWLAHTRPNQHLDAVPIDNNYAPERELQFDTLQELFRYQLGVSDTNNTNRGMQLFGNEEGSNLRSALRYRVRMSYDQINVRLRYRF